jgi:hypothetical protein
MTESEQNPAELEVKDGNLVEVLKKFPGQVIIVDKGMGFFGSKAENQPVNLELQIESELFRESEGKKIIFFNREEGYFYGELGRVTREFMEMKNVYELEDGFTHIKEEYLKEFMQKVKKGESIKKFLGSELPFPRILYRREDIKRILMIE